MGTSKKKNPERQRRRYTKEFKLEAVRLLELGQTPATRGSPLPHTAGTSFRKAPGTWTPECWVG